MKVTVKYFGKIAEITGQETEVWEVEIPSTLAGLTALMNDKYPQLREETYQLSVNQNVIKKDMPIPEGATVAILPPFAGG